MPSLPRFRVALLAAHGSTVALPMEAFHHAQVLRVKVGDSVRLFDGQGAEATAKVMALSAMGFSCQAGPRELSVQTDKKLVLLQALPKGSKLETSLRMATEIGVHEIRLAISERTVARPDEQRALGKVDRLKRIVQEACRQSERSHEPALYGPLPLLEMAAQAPAAARKMVFWEGSDVPLRRDFGSWTDVTEVWVVIGPEGGLSENEIQALQAMGYEHVRLGPTILRVETAVPVILGLIAERLGLLQPL